MEEHYEVPPASQRVVWLNGQHMKPMLAFEALTRALGWGYNHHKPQVVWQQDCSVRLEMPKVRRVRGHTSHAHPQAAPTAINTHVQMGTYLTFYLERRSSIQKCCLVLDGLEAVRPREGRGGGGGGEDAQGNRILITRLGSAANRHALEYPKGASHDEAPPSPEDIASRTLTAERLPTSPCKLSIEGKIFGGPGKLSRTSNRQQSSKASRSGKSCSKRKRHFRLTPARNTAEDNALRIDDALRNGVTADGAGDGNATTLDTSDVSEQKFVGNTSPRPPSSVENVGQVSDQLRENLNLRNVPENLHGQNDASRQTESRNRFKTFNESISNEVEKLTNCSNESDLDARSPKSNEINSREKDGCDTKTHPESSTKKDTESSQHSKLKSEHSGDLVNASGINRSASRSSTKSPLRGPGTPYRDSLGVSEDVWSVEADLSSPDEITAILSDEDSDGNDEWEDEDDEDIYKQVVRKCISADITALLHQPLSTSLPETSNCSNNSTEPNAARLHKSSLQCPSSIDCLNNINEGTALASPGGSIEDLNGARTRCGNPDRERNDHSSGNHRNGRNCGTRGLEPRNRSASSAGVGIYIHSDGSQDERGKERGRRGSLDPRLLLNAGNRPQGMRMVEGEAAPSNYDENAIGMERIEGREEEIDCEKMIKSYEQKIRLSKANSNQHALANHLIEEIIETRWNKTKLRNISNSRLIANSEFKHPSFVNFDTNHSEIINSTTAITPCNKPNTMVPPESDCTKVATSASHSDSTKESLLQNGGPPRASNNSPIIVLSSCPSLNGISPALLSPPCDGSNKPEPGELLMLLLRPRTAQQAWQFQSAHLTVWYRSRDQRRPYSEEGTRRPPQRTRLTYRTDTRPHTTRAAQWKQET